MTTTSSRHQCEREATSLLTNVLAGGGAGLMEALICHPLDTIKVRMQLSSSGAKGSTMKSFGFLHTAAHIVRKESPKALYKGLGAVTTGIVPKMAIRFTSFETYKSFLADKETGALSGRGTFLAGLAAGITEAVTVVNPMEVVKIRLQAQPSMATESLALRRYHSAGHALYTIVEVEGLRALYRGVSLTALRQGTNQAVNFTAYTKLKSLLQSKQPTFENTTLPSYQTTAIGLVSGALGPLCNAPIDTVKTRLQKTPTQPGVSGLSRILIISGDMIRNDGIRALYKGITPRIMRVAPGQAITFTVYEILKEAVEKGVSGRVVRVSEKVAI